MARPRKAVSLSLSSHQALYVLEQAVADRKLTSADVDRYVASMHHEISALERRLASLRDAVVEPVKHLFQRAASSSASPATAAAKPAAAPASSGGPAKAAKKRKVYVTPEVQASRRIQGQYISALRNLPKGKRAFYQQMARKDGREKAIAAIKAQGSK